MDSSLEKTLTALTQGKMIAVYDGDAREGETDLIFHAKFASPEKIEQLRTDAGGLICLAVDTGIANKLGLEFFSDIVTRSGSSLSSMLCRKTAYGDKPAFSISINHKEVYTGITDNDRSLTIKKFSEIVGSTEQKKLFRENFYTPGHVFLLIGSGIENRKGHTELSLELARMAGMDGIMVLCEMLGKGNAMPKEDVKEYCKRNRIEFVEGKEIYGR